MSAQSIAAQLREANANATPVCVHGGSTLDGMGSTARAQKRISTASLKAMIAHEYHDLTCSAQSGLTLAAFAAALAEHGQFVPLDAPQRNKATIGGTMAAGWLGPRRHFYGRARDFAIGSQVALADGTLANAGGMVVKNVSGYDVTKLYIGSFGTLGVITQMNFKTLPLPAARRILTAPLPENTRERAVAQLAQLPFEPTAALCVEGFRKQVDGEDSIDGRIILLLEGSQRQIDRATREVRSCLGRAGVPETAIADSGIEQMFDRVLTAPVLIMPQRSLTFRSLGLPETAARRARDMRDAANARELFTDVLTDVMNGDVFVRVSERDARSFAQKIEACCDAIRAADPRSVIVAGDPPIRESIDAWGEPPAAIEKMRLLKTRFDPNGILNPGRFAGGI